jgi:hypothetical protein
MSVLIATARLSAIRVRAHEQSRPRTVAVVARGSAHTIAIEFFDKILRDGSTATRTRGGCVVALGRAGVPGYSSLGFAPRTALLLVSGCVHLATAACFAGGFRVGQRPPARQLRQHRSIPPASAQCTPRPSLFFRLGLALAAFATRVASLTLLNA